MRIHPITCTIAVLLAAACSSNSPSGSNGSPAGAGGTHQNVGGSGGMSVASGGSGTSASGSAGSASTSGGNTSTAGSTSAAGNDQGGAPSTAGGSAIGGSAGVAGAAGSGIFVQPPLVTSTAGAYWVTSGTLTEAASGTADVTVNDTATAQTWDGFGAAFNEKGWDYLGQLSEAERNKALTLLFGKDGCNLTWGRIPMGASDYSTDRYSLDEVPAGQTDTAMASFSTTRDEQKLIPFVKAAQAVKSDLRFWASPWSPPTWMKDGPFNDDSPFDGGTMKKDDATLAAHALYFVKFVQAYKQKEIKIDVVSPQNEPGYSGTYPTCGWAPATYATFVGKHLGPALAQANLDTKIMLGTFNAGTGDTSIVSTVMGDTTASAKIGVLGYQWGMLGSVKGDQKYMHPIWQTEHKCGNYPWETPFNDKLAPNDAAYAVESWGLFRDWIKAGVASYSIWNMVLDTVGNGIDSKRVWPQNALLTVDTAAKKLNITPAYYVFRHLAQFVSPGAVVLGTTGGDALAFKNPNGSIVTVLYNSGAAKSYLVAVGGKKLQFQMPSAGWATIMK
ncbi:MAG TPA: glycoside hydrolase family 30 beta sandwich domain-containing protein [Polyangiaceae bacterium]|nr:glycoside hydrolase family 30 beta sandwich domain-containing protein [Polyangiaceae bacterium]